MTNMDFSRIKTVAFHTLGCKLNFAETSTIARSFELNGYQKVTFGKTVDVCVINTCSVTQLADKKCRETIRKAIRTSPNAIVVAIGCYTELKPDEVAKIQGIDLVLGANQKADIVAHINNYLQGNANNQQPCENEELRFFPSYSSGERTRSFLKVQDGCDYHCSYCTVAIARGKSRNQNIAKTVEQAVEIAKKGFKEIVLTGVNIGDFGKSTNENFYDLIQQLNKVKGIERYRISSIEPNLLTDEIIEFCGETIKFLPHFHIPLQSGNNKTLKEMRRRYKRELLSERIAKIRKFMPNAFIGIDLIVGFPGETDEDFRDTYDFLSSLEISFLHVFSYSERPNTPSANLQNKNSPQTKKLRSLELHELSEKKHAEFYQKHAGKTANVLFEHQQGNKIIGFTENYIKVETDFDEKLVNSIVKVKLLNTNKNGNFEIDLS